MCNLRLHIPQDGHSHAEPAKPAAQPAETSKMDTTPDVKEDDSSMDTSDDAAEKKAKKVRA